MKTTAALSIVTIRTNCAFEWNHKKCNIIQYQVQKSFILFIWDISELPYHRNSLNNRSIITLSYIFLKKLFVDDALVVLSRDYTKKIKMPCKRILKDQF